MSNPGSAARVLAKQGAYGKVKLHKHSVADQLMRPAEVFAALKLKFGGGLGTQKMIDGVEFLVHDKSVNVSQDDIDFCDTMLNRVSRSFAGVIAQLPNNKREPLRLAIGVFYLVLRALDTVEDDMDLSRFDDFVTSTDKSLADDNKSDPRLEAKQRMLRKFYLYLAPSSDSNKVEYEPIQGVGDGDEATLLESFDRVCRTHYALPEQAQKVIVAITKEMGEGMADYIARDLKDGTEDREDFAQYCHIVAGTVGDGLTQLFAAFNLETSSLVGRRDLWDRMGLFLQQTNIIRDYLEDLVDGRAFWPKSVWSKYVAPGAGLGGLVTTSSKEQRLGCLNHMVTDALELVPSCLRYLDELQCPPIIKFCALPQVMAIATLSECFNNPKVFTGVVKIRKGLAACLVMDCCAASADDDDASTSTEALNRLRHGYLTWFTECAKTILKNINPKDPNAKRTEAACKEVLKQTQQRFLTIKGKSTAPLSRALSIANVVASVTFVVLAVYFVNRSYQSPTLMPRLNNSTDATLAGIGFISVAYLLGFAGLPLALRG